MGYAWPGFRRVRRQVCKRIGWRLRELHLGDLDAYRHYLEDHSAEWRILDGLCWIPISRFGRDWSVFEYMGSTVLPSLCEGATTGGHDSIDCWSVGCARGEEPYTLAAVWDFIVAPSWPRLSISILATDIDAAQIDRAKLGLFKQSSIRELPIGWRDRMFAVTAGGFQIRPDLQKAVRFAVEDLRRVVPQATFDLILCRNLVLTYFDEEQRHRAIDRLIDCLRPGGVLVVGARERLPADIAGVAPWIKEQGIYRRTSPPVTQDGPNPHREP
jgi:chemotaxis protein methyltransferase CheR